MIFYRYIIFSFYNKNAFYFIINVCDKILKNIKNLINILIIILFQILYKFYNIIIL